ncbi:unnamed protein product [Spirodela intermedia]|uniref:Uncharacterized protein n=1 Tax=Spirodela intermedia TaxID=51605 RepID=A0A7I8JTE2_SPIIN|nr:unnamed protein product [Spirodela intermedia]CAA6673031.1 unnamed protein product [Spirodela intermedia]
MISVRISELFNFNFIHQILIFILAADHENNLLRNRLSTYPCCW